MLNNYMGIRKHRLTRGLVGYWFSDDSDPPVAYDHSGNLNHGTIYGASWTQGKVGRALSFDGVDDYVDCGSGASLNFGTGDFTIMIWTKPNKDTYNYSAPNNYNKYPDLLSKKYQFNGYYPGYMVWLDYRVAGVMELRINDGSQLVDNSPAPSTDLFSKFTDGSWRHIVFVVSPRNKVKYYLDGAYIEQKTITMTGSTDNNDHFEIGGRPTGTRFDGLIGEVAIWNRALSAEEIKALYHIGRVRNAI